ncbi:N-acetylmuramoyl-L-alanine amidase [Streptomyces luteolifulvus]|uniref:N-acetylmuramoyl-L-alanine amidase n=1 Tax=Streptomyces luteolifulvus TaxID=2615112 RepID=A0A6H9V1H5_9ACTN|nr:peptidoglycan recognition family protein [Streptomyces luteolifulvus]KAB1146839.1 N-acetylmuramoyl-L-alanine amidase [Streptomyces luteolifulvus]
MATPMTATQVVTQLKKWGIRYVEIPGWATHNRNTVGAWGPVHGFVWHHTGVDVSDAAGYAAGTLYNGLAGLPGPLCQFSIGADGTTYLVGWGRANHAGGGDPAVLAHVINEDYTGQLHPTVGNRDGVDGNARFYGVEIQYSGSHEMTAAQYAAARRLSAAILDFHGWSEKSVIAHGEWSSDKWDPGYAPGKIMAMPGVRADVLATLIAGPLQEDDMPTAAEIAAEVAKTLPQATWLTDGFVKNPNPATAGDNPYIAPATGLRNIEIVVRRTEKALAELPAVELTDQQIATLAAAVAANPALAELIAEKVAVKLAERLAE